MFSNWFKKNKDLKAHELESIDIDPDIQVPSKIREELYNAAVTEVYESRVKALIYKSLTDIIDNTEESIQYRLAVSTYGPVVDEEMVLAIKTEFPSLKFRYCMPEGSGKCEFVKPKYDLESLADVLTRKYLSE